MKTQISLTIDERVICEIDRQRGLIPRSRIVEKMLIDSMNFEVSNVRDITA